MTDVFKPADFCEKSPEDEPTCPHGVGNDWCSGTYNAARANALLRERGVEVFGGGLPEGTFWHSNNEDVNEEEIEKGGYTAYAYEPTHRALLVCVEPLSNEVTNRAEGAEREGGG